MKTKFKHTLKFTLAKYHHKLLCLFQNIGENCYTSYEYCVYLSILYTKNENWKPCYVSAYMYIGHSTYFKASKIERRGGGAKEAAYRSDRLQQITYICMYLLTYVLNVFELTNEI